MRGEYLWGILAADRMRGAYADTYWTPEWGKGGDVFFLVFRTVKL